MDNDKLKLKLNTLYSLVKDSISSSLKEGKNSIYLPHRAIAAVDIELAEEVLEKPKEILPKFNEFFSEKLGIKVKVRIYDLPSDRFLRIRDIRSEHIGKLIETEGIIKVSSEVRPVVYKVKYKHTECGREFWTGIFEGEFLKFKIDKPKVCPICNKPEGKFIELEKKTIDMQRLLIEETPDQIERGEQPAQIMTILTEDLCEPKMERRTIPGTRVKIVGIVEAVQNSKNQAVLDIVINALYIEPVEKDIEDIKLSDEDIIKIKELAKSGDILNLLAKSIAPSIHGRQYEPIKKAIVLQLVGGNKKIRPDGTKVRGDIHILLIGDPGTGKSQLLQFVTKVAPKARFVSGVTASAVGLTANVRRDEFLKGGWALEAGALVLASGGIVCIDELDKINKDEMLALHEALEQQTITVNKANIHATLKSEVAVLAAANPKFGRWDKMKSIVDQIDLPPTIINRFDLIFILRDEPDEKLDKLVAEGVVRGLTEKIESVIPIELLRKYIIYAKKLYPEWTESAKQKVIDFYLTLRKSSKDMQTIPISTRQLESIIRLAEAVAKVRLSNKVTEEDVEVAKSLLMKSLKEVGINPETRTLDVDLINVGVSSTQRARLSTIYDIIKNLQKDFSDGVPYQEIVNAAKDYQIEENKVKEALERLLKNGDIYEPKPGFYKIAG